MNKNIIIAALIGIIVGAGMTFGATSLAQQSEQNDSKDHSMMSMSEMNEQLARLSGDDFDKAFLSMMIAHHQGAIDMAEYAESQAKHDEIKTLSSEIIGAQKAEIAEMKQWQQEWGYGADSSMMQHMGH